MMKRTVFLAGMLAALLTLGLVLTGCDNGSTSDSGPVGGLNLGGITEKTTGNATIVVTNAVLTGDAIPDGTYSDGGGFSGTVTNGKLTLTLGTPTGSLSLVSQLNSGMGWYFGQTDDENALTISDATAEYYVFSGLGGSSSDGKNYGIDRYAEFDGGSYYDGSSIYYFYVDKDVTLTRPAKTFTDYDGYPSLYTAINLHLKAGWNLVQIDTRETEIGRTYTVKIATNNVPWSVYSYSY